MKITNIVASSGIVYYHATDLSADFDPTNPVANGWQMYDPSTATQPIQAIAVVHGNTMLCQSDGDFTIKVYGEAKDASDVSVPIGFTLPYTARVATLDPEPNQANNTADHEITTPGLDLALQITGQPEGAYPGNVPGGLQKYIVEYQNVLSTGACDVRIRVEVPDTLEEYAVLHNFNSIQLTDVQ